LQSAHDRPALPPLLALVLGRLRCRRRQADAPLRCPHQRLLTGTLTLPAPWEGTERLGGPDFVALFFLEQGLNLAVRF
jgi:hypothetical protein